MSRTTNGPIAGKNKATAPAPAPKNKGGRKTPPPNETNRDRFLRVVTPRVDRIIVAVGKLGKLSKYSYEYDASDLDAIEGAVTGALKTALAKLTPVKKEDERERFSFSGKRESL